MIEQLLPGLSSAANLHPLVVHFPIAFWVAATGAWITGVVRGSDIAWLFGRWLHLLGLAGGVAAVALGFGATATMGHDGPGHDLVHVHRDLMLWTTALSLVVTAIAWWQTARRWRVALAIASVLLTVLLAFGADRGAMLVFRYGMGVAREVPVEASQAHGHGGHTHGVPHRASPESASPRPRPGGVPLGQQGVEAHPPGAVDAGGPVERTQRETRKSHKHEHDHGGHAH